MALIGQDFTKSQEKFRKLREALRKRIGEDGTLVFFDCIYQTFEENLLVERWNMAIADKVAVPVLVECWTNGIMQVFLPATMSNEIEKEILNIMEVLEQPSIR